MGKFGKMLLCFLCAILLCGCKKAEPKPVTLVTRVQVQCRQAGDTVLRSYTDPEKMDAVLLYLAGARPYGVADRDPEQVIGRRISILLELSDGSTHTYRQWADRYFSKNYARWRLVDPEKAARLYGLLQALPSDDPLPPGE